MSTYHLHIPRTGGVFIREQIIRRLDNVFAGHRDLLPKTFSGFDHVSGHFATTPIKDTDHNFAVVRDPVDLTFSYINYMRDVFYSEKSFDYVFTNYLSSGKISNFVDTNIKFLTGTVDIDLYNKGLLNIKDTAENGWYVSDFCTNVESAVAAIEKNRTELIFFEDPDRHARVCKIYKADVADRKINESSSIERSTYDKHYETVAELNKLDILLYEKLLELEVGCNA